MTRNLNEMARFMQKQTDKSFEECMAILTAIPPDELDRIVSEAEALAEAWRRDGFNQVDLPPGRRH